jgi:hypothetical protein
MRPFHLRKISAWLPLIKTMQNVTAFVAAMNG